MKKLLALVLALVFASTMMFAAETKPAAGTDSTTASAPAKTTKAKHKKGKHVKKAAVAVKTPEASK